MTRRVMTWGPVVATVTASALLIGAEPAAPRAMPPLPVPPIPREAMPPFFARITISGGAPITGVFEQCVDPAADAKRARARASARPADAPSPLAGCSNAHEMRPDGSLHAEMSCKRAPPPMTGCSNAHDLRPDGSIHGELSCDRAKGAKASFRMVSDGTANDLHMHMERYDADAAGAPKTTVFDSHIVRLGPCPPDLKPGEMRRPGGPIIETGEAARVLEGSRGAAP